MAMSIRGDGNRIAEMAEMLGIESYRMANMRMQLSYTPIESYPDPYEIRENMLYAGQILDRMEIESINVPGRVAHPELQSVLLYLKTDEDKPTLIYDVESDDYVIGTVEEYRKVVAV